MFSRLLVCALLAVSAESILDFKLLVDKRIVNEKGQMNPIPFLREGFKVMKPYENATEQVQLDVLKNFVRTTYGPDMANKVDSFLTAVIQIAKQLPDSLKSHINDNINQLSQKLQFELPMEQIRSQVPSKELWNRIVNEIVPKAQEIFYNPLDQEANKKLPADQVTVIEHSFF